MIHYLECSRCTHQWMGSCSQEFMMDEAERKHFIRQLLSALCSKCFAQLESGELDGLMIYDLYNHLRSKSDLYDFRPRSKYGGMCHEYRETTYNPDGSVLRESNFVSGMTAEQKQLHAIIDDVMHIYEEIIARQRTRARIELDEFQKEQPYYFGSYQPRPEGFVGDP